MSTGTRRGLPAIFRLTEAAPAPGLDVLLSRRGYSRIDDSLVLHRPLSAPNIVAPSSGTAAFNVLDRVAWLAHFHPLSPSSTNLAAHQKLLERIRAPQVYAALHIADAVVACGLGVLDDGCFGLFDIVTGAAYRRQGYSRALIEQMLAWAVAQGAQHAYLNVVAHNTAAQQLYTQLGFQPAYGYWYRVAPPLGTIAR